MKYWICETFRQPNFTAFQQKTIEAIIRFLQYAGRLPTSFNFELDAERGFCDESVLQPDGLHCGFVLLWRLINFGQSGKFKKVCENVATDRFSILRSWLNSVMLPHPR